MGYGLFFESMLDTVLYARDKYLKPDGALLPDVCCIKITGFTKLATVDFDFWNDVYGFSMKEVAVQQLDHALATAVVKHVEGEHIERRRRKFYVSTKNVRSKIPNLVRNSNSMRSKT